MCLGQEPAFRGSEDDSTRAAHPRIYAESDAEGDESGAHVASGGESCDHHIYERRRRTQTIWLQLQSVLRHQQLGPLFDHAAELIHIFGCLCSVFMNMHVVPTQPKPADARH